MFLAGRLVLGRHVENTVGVDVEGDFNLGNATTCGSDSFEVELADGLVLSCHRTLALQHVDGDGGLVVDGGREGFRLLARNGRVGINQLRHHATERLDSERQRSHVEQHDVAHTAFLVQNSTLNRGTDSHHFIRIHTLRRLFAEIVLHERLHGGNTARTTHEDDFVDVAGREFCVAHGVLAGHEASLNQRVGQLLELGACERLYKVLRHTAFCRDIRQVDFGRRGRRKFDFRLLGSLFQALHCHRVFREVDTLVGLEAADEPVDDDLVEIVATEVGVAIR